VLRLLFASTLFVSAGLLFVAQPMVAKMVLPLLGGTPAVWITCMVFFQAMLLAGYLYAHLTTSWLGTRRQAVLHLVVLLLPLAALPFMRLPMQLAAGGPLTSGNLLGPVPGGGNPTVWLLELLLLCIGLPFFAVATSAPLLQKWFASTGHPDAADPYFLYGASNLGSMLALLGYPVVVEPLLRLATQADTWIAGYGLLLLLTALCAIAMWRSRSAALVVDEGEDAALATETAPSPSVSWPDRLYWIVLAFVPSSLLLGVTTYMSTDLAALPLFWVVPLALYLLTFILAFSRFPLPTNWLARALPALILLQLVFIARPIDEIWPMLVLHLTTFFVASLVCHAELARRRPPADHLTGFYLCMSAGGFLGGLFSAVLAPLVFNTIAEYPLELTLACLIGPPVLRPVKPKRSQLGSRLGSWRFLVELGMPIAAGLLAAVAVIYLLPEKPLDDTVNDKSRIGVLLTAAVGLVGCLGAALAMKRPLLLGLSIGCVLLAQNTNADFTNGLVYQKRTFFGVLRVNMDRWQNSRKLTHGTTLHGAQSLDPARRDEPLSYYHRQGPLGSIFGSLDKASDTRPIAVVGLGTGSIACYGHKGQEMDFYEIDAEDARIAGEDGYFTFLHDSSATIRVILGDGRLSLGRAPDKHYHLIILDAFSSDAVPVHLLTREAVRNVYLHKLADDGLLAFHISNRYMDLRPVLADVARDAGLDCRVRWDAKDLRIGKAASEWAIMAPSAHDLGSLATDKRWLSLKSDPLRGVWTDDFSNVLRIIRWR
jgi:hypothetical protein